MTTRSARLGVYKSVDSSAHTIYSSPTGWRTILKDVRVENETASVQHVEVLAVAGDVTCAPRLLIQDLPAVSIASWTGWLILNPGDSVMIIAAAANVDFWVSGTQLPDPGPLP